MIQKRYGLFAAVVIILAGLTLVAGSNQVVNTTDRSSVQIFYTQSTR